MRTNKWGPFFEDIPTEDFSDTEINADTMAAYILEHPAWDANWRDAGALDSRLERLDVRQPRMGAASA